jgi:hypothetical protein
MRKRNRDLADSGLTDTASQDSPPPPPPPRRPTLRPLTDDNWEEVAHVFIRSIMAGNDKDTSAAVAGINTMDMMRLLAVELSKNPEWLNDAAACGKVRLKGISRLKAMEKVEDGDGSFVASIVQATNSDLSPRREELSQGVTYNIMVFNGDKKNLPAPPVEAVIDVPAE